MEVGWQSSHDLGKSIAFALTNPGAFNTAVTVKPVRVIIIGLARDLPFILGTVVDDEMSVVTLVRARNIVLRHMLSNYFFDRLIEAHPEGSFEDPIHVVLRRQKAAARKKIRANDAFLAEYLKKPAKERQRHLGVPLLQRLPLGPVSNRVIEMCESQVGYHFTMMLTNDPWDFLRSVLYN